MTLSLTELRGAIIKKNGNKTLVESVQLGKTLDLELIFVYPPPQGIRLSVVGGWVRADILGGGGEFLSAMLDYKVPGTSISMCTFTAMLTYSALSDPHSHCFQWFPGLGGPRGKHPWQGLSSQTGLALTSRLRAGIGQLLPG